MKAIKRIDEHTARPADRIRLITLIGNYLNENMKQDREANKARLEKKAQELGVTVSDLIAWFFND